MHRVQPVQEKKRTCSTGGSQERGYVLDKIMSFLYNEDIRKCRTSPLSATNRYHYVQFFHMGQPIGHDFAFWVLGRGFFILFLPWKQPMEVTSFTHFYRLFFHLFKWQVHYSSLILQLGYILFLGTQLYFKDGSCRFQRCLQFPVLAPRLTACRLAVCVFVFLNRCFLLFSNFSLLTFIAAHISISTHQRISLQSFKVAFC